jgi:hypothetical protein
MDHLPRFHDSLPLFNEENHRTQIGNELHGISGYLHLVCGSWAFRIKGFHLGGSIARLHGKRIVSLKKLFFSSERADDCMSAKETVENTILWRCAAGWKGSDVFSVWIVYGAATTLSWRTQGDAGVADGSDAVVLPHIVRIGGEISRITGDDFRDSQLSTRMVCEVELQVRTGERANPLSMIRQAGYVQCGFHAGIDREVTENVSVQLGCCSIPSNSQDATGSIALSAGVSKRWKGCLLRLIAEMSLQNVPEEEEGTVNGVMEEKVFRFCAGVDFSP